MRYFSSQHRFPTVLPWLSTFLKYELKYDVTVYGVKIKMMSPPRCYHLQWTMLPYTMLIPFPIKISFLLLNIQLFTKSQILLLRVLLDLSTPSSWIRHPGSDILLTFWSQMSYLKISIIGSTCILLWLICKLQL